MTMELGQRVYLLSGFDVEEWEVYEIRKDGRFPGPYIRRDNRMGMAASHYLTDRIHLTLDEAVAASKAAREREIKRCARLIERLAINTNIKVRLLKKGKS